MASRFGSSAILLVRLGRLLATAHVLAVSFLTRETYFAERAVDDGAVERLVVGSCEFGGELGLTGVEVLDGQGSKTLEVIGFECGRTSTSLDGWRVGLEDPLPDRVS